MVFAKLVIEVVEEMRAKGIDKPIVASLVGDVEVEQACRVSLRARYPGVSVHDREAGDGAGREVSMGARRGSGGELIATDLAAVRNEQR